jgi:hypothetical protein
MKRLLFLMVVNLAIVNNAYCNYTHVNTTEKKIWVTTRAPIDPVPYIVDENDAVGIYSNCQYENVVVEIYSGSELVSYEVIPELLPDVEYPVNFSRLPYGNYSMRISVGTQYVIYDIVY